MKDMIMKGANFAILAILISAFAAGILTVAIWAQPDLIIVVVNGGFWYEFYTFLLIWGGASLLAWLLMRLSGRGNKGSIAKVLSE